MAEALNRWNGSAWVPVSTVNRIVVETIVETPDEKDYMVRFIDYDGTVLKTVYCYTGESATPPSAPTHDGKIFDGWNYNSAQLSNITHDLDVGAMYKTADGKTELRISITTALSPKLYLNKSDSSEMTIDWGDGFSEVLTVSGAFNKTRTYAKAGYYSIKIWISSGSGTYVLGNGTVNTPVSDGKIIEAYIGDNVTGLAAYAFGQRYNIAVISLPSAITTIGNGAFTDCNVLTYITIPTLVTYLGESMFTNNYALSKVSIPNGVTNIWTGLFTSCGALRKIVLPDALQIIQSYTFSSCGSLEKVVAKGALRIETYAFQYCTSLTKIEITEGINTLQSYAFQYCKALTSVTIPSTVTVIGDYVFTNCNACREIILRPTNPPTLGLGFISTTLVFPVFKIKVPAASLSAYQAATNWSTYRNYMEGY